MKKFILSLAIMLSAVTMNVNAMRDSWAYEYVQPNVNDIYQSVCNDALDDNIVIPDFLAEVKSLFDEFTAEKGGGMIGLYILYQHGIIRYYSSNLYDACQMLQVLHTIKMEEEAGTGFTD